MNGQKFLRGQIWWIGTSKEIVGSVMSNNRPYLIISNNIGNRCSPTVIVIPCTTAENKKPLPTHVECEINGVKNTLLCEQIKTVNNTDLLSYMFTLDDSIMNKVEDSIKVALGIIDKNEYDILVSKPKIEPIQEESKEIIKEEHKNEEPIHITTVNEVKRKTWTLEEKAKYIKFVEENGLRKAGEEYKIGWNAKSYYFRFCKALSKVPQEV